MRWALSTIVLLACSSTTSAPDIPVDSGPTAPGPSPLTVTLDHAKLTLVRGESANVVVSVASPIKNHPPAIIGFGQLPIGMSGTSATWEGQSQVTLMLTASADAPNVDMTLDVRATQTGAIVGGTPLTVGVSGIDGSLGTTFGQDGYTTIPDAELHHIETASDGGWRVTGVSLQQGLTRTLVATLDSSGAVTSTVFHDVAELSYFHVESWATNTDGRVAFGAVAMGKQFVIVLDPTGAATSVTPVPDVALPIGWSGDDVIVGQPTGVLSIDMSQQVTPIASVQHAASFLSTADGLYITTASPAGIVRWSNGAPDATFTADVATANFVALWPVQLDSSGRLLVGGIGEHEAAIVRMLPTGDLDVAFGNQGIAAALFPNTPPPPVDAMIELPSGDLLLVSSAVTRFSQSGLVDMAFGVSGQARLGGSTSAAAGIGRLCMTSLEAVYCLRLAP